MLETINTLIGILAIYGVWYGTYRYFAFYSADYMQLHEALNQEIMDEATACSIVAVGYVGIDPRGGYNLTSLGRCANQDEIVMFQDRLRTLRDKIQLALLDSPSPWRFRFAARWKFYGNVRQWHQIRGVCDSIVLRLSGDRSTADVLQ